MGEYMENLADQQIEAGLSERDQMIAEIDKLQSELAEKDKEFQSACKERDRIFESYNHYRIENKIIDYDLSKSRELVGRLEAGLKYIHENRTTIEPTTIDRIALELIGGKK